MKENLFTPKIIDIVVPMEQDGDGYQSFSDVFIVTDFQPQNLSNIFDMVRSDSFTVEHAMTIMYNLLCGLKYLHSAKVCHGHICPENILITSNCNVLLSDFKYA